MNLHMRNGSICNQQNKRIESLSLLFQIEKETTYHAELIGVDDKAFIQKKKEAREKDMKDTHYIVVFNFDDYNQLEFKGYEIIDAVLSKEQQVAITNHLWTYAYGIRVPVVANEARNQDEIGLFIAFRAILERTNAL